MKRNKFIGIAALMPLVLSNLVAMPVYAEVTESQTIDTGTEETSAECEVIYKSTYDFSEEIPKYPELDVTASGYEGVYDGKSHGIIVDSQVDGNADAGISRVQTGDESYIFFYAVMLIASAFGLTRLKKREEKRKL